MGFNCGIVGLPNVGKSTLFNALTSTAAAEAANYPFCTIEPNVGRVAIPDERLDKLAEIAGSAKVIAAQQEFVDIAGLVRGASKGEGLGNQFLGNIRDTDAILHVLRCFDGEVTHVDGSVDPVRDAETVDTELLLADLESIEKRLPNLKKRAQQGDKELKALVPLLERVQAVLEDGKAARTVEIDKSEESLFRQQQFLTAKRVLYVCNVGEDDAESGNAYTQAVAKMAAEQGAEVIIICAAFEAELAMLESEEERTEYLSSIGLEEPGLARLIRAGYGLLSLQTYFTAGPKEARAWTIRTGSTAPEAAGVIHSDFERGFIRAETIAYEDYVGCNGETGAKDAGKMRAEGKDYIVKDGDVLLFRFNV